MEYRVLNARHPFYVWKSFALPHVNRTRVIFFVKIHVLKSFRYFFASNYKSSLPHVKAISDPAADWILGTAPQRTARRGRVHGVPRDVLRQSRRPRSHGRVVTLCRQ